MRDFDIVVFGATGFTGKLVAQYLARVGQERWAIAGRNPEKLRAVLDTLTTNTPPEILVGDANDSNALHEIASRTVVVLTTVGPYAKYGDALVEACAAQGTHYCDLTGEVQWMRRTIDAHHEKAQQSGARIVHTCGFDSIPSDLGTLEVQRVFLEREGHYADEVGCFVMYASGGFSGGTVASMVNLMEEAADKSVRKTVAHPYALNPEDDKQGADTWDSFAPAYDDLVDAWTAPFLMSSVNTRVVRRSHALLGHPWGAGFRYREVMSMGKGLKGRAKALAMSAALGAAVATLSMEPTRKLAQKTVLPEPGEGPSEAQITAGGFLMRVIGRRGAKTHAVDVKASLDPGYGATAIMLSESARCLAYDDLQTPCGVLTPAVAMGESLVSRLNASGVTFTVR